MGLALGRLKKDLPIALLILGLLPIGLAQSVPVIPRQLAQVVSRIALYPDPLLAQTLTASTFWTGIPEAATWADQHTYPKGDALAPAIQGDHLQWGPCILGLLPFPSVLDMMASDPAWTQQLGNAVLNQRPEVTDAVQRMRREARDYGYLVPNGYVNVVDAGGYIEIRALNPAVFYVPYYDSVVVRSSSAWRRCRRCDPLRTGGDDLRDLRDVGLVDGSRVLLADSRHRHGRTSMGTGLGQQGRIRSPVCASLGSSARTEGRDSPYNFPNGL